MEISETTKEKLERGKWIIESRVIQNLFQNQFPSNTFHRFHENGIWEVLINFITEPLDIVSLNRTCNFFEDICREKLITEVFQVLKKNNFFEDRQYLPLRLVCKSWRKGTETVFMNAFTQDWHLNYLDGILEMGRTPLQRPSGVNLASYGIIEKDHPNVIIFSSPHQIDRAMSILQESTSPAALIQLICINEKYCPPEKMAEFYRKISGFLKIYGRNVQGLHFRFNSPDWKNMYDHLLEVVNNLPEVKALVLRGEAGFIRDNLRPSIPEYLRRHPFPKLSHLELLRFDYLRATADIVAEILKKTINLKCISFPKSLVLPVTVQNVIDKLPLEFLHARSHPFDQRNPNRGPGFSGEFRGLRFLTVTWPLRKIITHKLDCPTIRAPEVVPLLNRFRDTLEHLEWLNSELQQPFTVRESDNEYLDTPNLKKIYLLGGKNPDNFTLTFPNREYQNQILEENENFDLEVELDLPHLKTLRLGFIDVPTNGLNFLRNLKALEYLEIDQFKYFAEIVQGKFRVFGAYEGEINHGNVWQICRNLREIKIKYCSMARAITHYRP